MLAQCCKRRATIRLTLCQRLEFADWLCPNPVNLGIDPMLFLCRANSRTTLSQCFVFAVISVLAGATLSRGASPPPPPRSPTSLSAAVTCVIVRNTDIYF